MGLWSSISVLKYVFSRLYCGVCAVLNEFDFVPVERGDIL